MARGFMDPSDSYRDGDGTTPKRWYDNFDPKVLAEALRKARGPQLPENMRPTTGSAKGPPGYEEILAPKTPETKPTASAPVRPAAPGSLAELSPIDPGKIRQWEQRTIVPTVNIPDDGKMYYSNGKPVEVDDGAMAKIAGVKKAVANYRKKKAEGGKGGDGKTDDKKPASDGDGKAGQPVVASQDRWSSMSHENRQTGVTRAGDVGLPQSARYLDVPMSSLSVAAPGGIQPMSLSQDGPPSADAAARREVISRILGATRPRPMNADDRIELDAFNRQADAPAAPYDIVYDKQSPVVAQDGPYDIVYDNDPRRLRRSRVR